MKKFVHAMIMYYFLFKFADAVRKVLEYLHLRDALVRVIQTAFEDALLGKEEAAKFRSKQWKTSPFRTDYSRPMTMTRTQEEIILPTRAEASEVIDKLCHLLKEDKAVSVAKLYELVGLTAGYKDEIYGWQSLPEVRVTKVKGGYRLDLPPAERFQ